MYVCAFMCTQVPMCDTILVWRSEDNWMELVLAFLPFLWILEVKLRSSGLHSQGFIC